jgi:hypothetical protein
LPIIHVDFGNPRLGLTKGRYIWTRHKNPTERRLGLDRMTNPWKPEFNLADIASINPTPYLRKIRGRIPKEKRHRIISKPMPEIQPVGGNMSESN